jgi:hypothetical protein
MSQIVSQRRVKPDGTPQDFMKTFAPGYSRLAEQV